MQESDLSQVYQIEQASFPSPWPVVAFRDCVQAGLDCWVVEQHGIIEAYSVMSIEADTAYILNFCVRSASRRRGLGRALLSHLLTRARHHGATTVRLEVRASNTTAQQFYQALGFQHVGRLQAYVRTPQGLEDVLIMARDV
jgi:ribosomal-protein-alanine N-acetyltransferase